MSMENENLKTLREQVSPKKHNGKRTVYPKAKPELLDAAEKELGLRLPILLRQIYLEIGNGGSHLGPGFGMLGVTSGFDNNGDGDLIAVTKDFRRKFKWWNPNFVVIGDRGCCMYTCIDCASENYPIYLFDGNAIADFCNEHGDGEVATVEPPGTLTLECDTLDKWLLTPNARRNA